MLNPRGVGLCESLVHCRPFNRNLLTILQFLLLPQSPLVFAARNYGYLHSWSWNPGLGSLVWGWDCLLPRCPSRFLSTTHECGTFCSSASLRLSMSPPLLPIWMNVASLNPLWLDSHTARFSDKFGWYLFCSLVVILAVVVHGDKAYLPTPLSWLKSPQYLLMSPQWPTLGCHIFFIPVTFCFFEVSQ